ncbi:hypothetical protein PD691P6_00042 [Parabacteroides phage PD691P6]|nr:hypothetical protein PD691P6_00042 [Parabacteroides phage PD691P6]
MTPNNNLNPLAFYKSQNDMFKARPYNYGIKYPLYMPLNRVTPFQIIRGSSESTTLTSAKIYNDRGVEVATVTSYMSVNVVTIGNSKVMQFKCGNYANLTPGQYTMRVVIGNDTYYSEVFTAYANIGKLVKVEYYNADPIIFDEGALTYDNGFKFELFLCTEIAKPEYLFEEESTKRGGFTFVENQISSKQYKMVIAAPEYLCDAIRIIRLHDHVAITKDGNAYEAYNFTPSYQWNDVGDLAQVVITFESNTVLQKISAYKGSQSVFKNALLAAASVPIMFSPNVIAQYGASVDGVAEAYTEFTGKLIRQLEEQTTLPKEAWVAIDTGTGEAKKMSIGLLGGGTGKPSELWTNDKKIKYLYIKEDNSEAYITKQFIGDSNIMAKGDIVAYQSGNWDLVTPTAGYDTLGMARFNSSDFTIDNGLVGLKVGAVGQRYYAGKGLSLASINGGTDNQFNVVFGELENTVMQGNDARFLKLYNGTWWGQAFDKSTGIVKGAMTSVDSINTLVYFNTDKSILVTKNKSAEGIKFSGGNSINGVYGSATNNLYLNYTDATHNVKIDANHNIFANGDIVAYASGNYDISKPLAGYDAVGMSRYDKTQFEVVNGLVRIIDGGGGGTIAGIEITGNGNAFTNASMKSDNTVISFDKGITFWHAGNDGKNSGLDADLVDGYHAGFENNRVALYANFPSWSALISQGLLRSDYENAGHPTEDFLKAICKWAIKNYTNIGNVTLQGKTVPYSSGWLVLSLYSDTGFDATTLLPKYCSGQFNSLSGNLQLFGTENSKWRYSGAFVGNASSSSKLLTARTIWGQSFNGTANVSGNMTGVGNITMSGNIYMGNNRNIYAKNPDGSDMAIFYTNTNSELVIGTGNTQKGTNTYLSGYEIIFRTSTSVEERMRIISNGNIGIGTNAPAAKLDIKGNQDLIHLQAKADGKDEYNYIRAYNTYYDSSFRFVEISNKILWLQYGKVGSNQLYRVNISGMSSEALKEFRVKAKDSFFEGNAKASGDVVAYQSGTWDIVKPIAGKDALGMIKVGSGLSIDASGVLSSTGGGGSIAGVTPGTAGDFVYELASSGNNIVYNRKTFASVLDGRYVKKAGDTMTGKLKINSQLEILSDITDLAITLSRTVEENDAYPDIAMIMKLNDKKIGYVSGDLKKGTVLGNYQSGKNLQISPTGYLIFGGQNVWHAGNDGSDSGLDADMLDGLHNTAFARADQNPAVDLNTVNGRGIMTNTANANATTERHYPIAQAGVLFYGTAAYGSANQIYGSFSSNRWFARGGGGNESATGNSANKTNWREFAFTDSNVASATKLQTARTIWGKSFNGTADISGNLSNVSSIYSTNSTFAIYKNDKYIISSNNAGQLNINAYDANIILFGYRGTSGYSFYAGTGAGDAVGSEIGYWTNDVFTIKTNIKSYHVYPITNNTYDLGTSSARWKRLYLSGVNGSWLMGKTDGSIMVDSSNSSTSTYFPLYRWKTYTGRVFNLGGLQGADSSHQFGFYMFDKDQTENRTNASFYMYSNGNMNGTHSLIMQQDVVAYGSSSYNITSPTAGYDALGLARFDSTYFTVSSGYVTLKASATSPIRSVTATTLNPGSNANASWNSSTGALSLGIPRGNTGATGTQGASVTYQWSGTSLRMGVTPYGGSTAWGSYVNLKGATGSPGPSWNGGEVTNNITIKATWGALGLSGGTNNFYLSQRGDNIVYFCFGGTNNNKGSFSPSGNMYVSGSYSNGSDIRLKYRLEDISDILGKIKDISAFYYIRKDLNDGVIRIGVSAQDVIKQFPQVVSNNSINGKEYYSVEYATLGVAIAVNGLKEVHQLVQDNKNEIDLLKIEIASLKERLAKLEAA